MVYEVQREKGGQNFGPVFKTSTSSDYAISNFLKNFAKDLKKTSPHETLDSIPKFFKTCSDYCPCFSKLLPVQILPYA